MTSKSCCGTVDADDLEFNAVVCKGGVMKRRQKNLLIIIPVLSVLVLLLVLLPFLLSTASGKKLVVRVVSGYMAPARLTVEDWNLSWISGINVSGLVYVAPEKGSVSIKRISIENGLTKIASLDFGKVELVGVAASVIAPGRNDFAVTGSVADDSKRTEPSPEKQAEKKSIASKKSGTPKKDATPATLPENIKIRLIAKDASLKIISGEQSYGFMNITLDASCDTLTNPVNIAFGLDEISGDGRLDVFGEFTIPQEGAADISKIRGTLKTDASNFNLAPVLALASADSSIPQVGGRANVSAEIRFQGAEDLALKGNAVLLNLMLKGGVLGEDVPMFEKITTTIDLTVKGKALTLNKFELDSPLLIATGAGALDDAGGKMPYGKLEVQGRLDLAVLSAQLPRMMKLDKNTAIREGFLSFVANIDSDSEKTTLVVNTKLPSIQASKDGHTVSLNKPLAFDCRTTFKGDEWKLEEFTFDSFFAQLKAEGSRAEGASLFSRGRLEDLSGLLKIIGVMKEDVSVSGAFQLDGTCSLKESEWSLPLAFSGKDVRVSAGTLLLEEPSVDIALDGKFMPKIKKLVITKLDLVSMTAGLHLSGEVARVDTDKAAGFSGVLDLDYDRINNLIKMFSGLNIIIGGKDRSDFKFKGVLGKKDDPGFWNTIEGDFPLNVPVFSFMGLSASNVQMHATAHRGVVRFPFKCGVNGGEVTLDPTIRTEKRRSVLKLPSDSRVMNHVAVTDELVTELLARIHPVLRGSGVVSGDIGLVLQHCVVPLDEKMKEDMRIAGSFDLNNLVLTPTGLLKDIIELCRLEPKSVTVPRDALSFTVEKGILKPSPLYINGDNFSLTFAGYIGLGGELHYTVEVPVHENMVPAEVYKYVKNVKLRLEIGGTVSNPKLGREQFLKALGNLAKDAAVEAGKEAFKSSGEKLLKGLLDKNK